MMYMRESLRVYLFFALFSSPLFHLFYAVLVFRACSVTRCDAMAGYLDVNLSDLDILLDT
jgi:hypothetical protein